MSCSCYHTKIEEQPRYNTITGQIDHYVDIKYGVCWGTKEQERCTCNGDEYKCDFYETKRNKIFSDVVPIEHKPTNYDRIHLMTPDELAEFLSDTGICKMCIYDKKGCEKYIRPACKGGIKKWLESEADYE